MNAFATLFIRRQLPVSSTWSLALGFLLLFGVTAPVGAGERVLERELPTEGIEALVIGGGNGSVHVTVGDENVVRIRVEVRPENWSDSKPWQGIKKWFLSSAYEDIDDLMNAMEIDTSPSSAGEIRVGLTPSIRTRESKVREDWQITVPRRLAIHIAMMRATSRIDGVAGGVELSLGKGSADVDVPGGDLDIEVTVGKARVFSGSESVRKLSVRSQVGDTSLWMNGMRMKYPRPPGPGSHVSLTGDGDDSIRIFVQVGDASLRVNGK